MYPYVALRCPTYRENSHANHTWHPPSHQTACFKGSEAPARVGSIPIARSTFRCLACPCVVLGRAWAPSSSHSFDAATIVSGFAAGILMRQMTARGRRLPVAGHPTPASTWRASAHIALVQYMH